MRTLTGQEIELDIESEYTVRLGPYLIVNTHADTQGTGQPDQGQGGGKGRHPASAAASDLRWQADVSQGHARRDDARKC